MIVINFKRTALVATIFSSALILSACSLYGTPTSTPTTNQTPSQSTAAAPQAGSMITYTANGFSPTNLKVKVGQRIDFKNASQNMVQVNSNPHPTHTLYPQLNIGAIAPGETKSVTLTKAGTYQYHNHLNASQGGTIVVE